MKINALYISAQEKNVGALFVSMGMMEMLKRNIDKVAFFRPIIPSKDVLDRDIEFMVERYKLGMEYEECYGFDLDSLETLLASSGVDEVLGTLVAKFQKLGERYDFILCEGIARSLLPI